MEEYIIILGAREHNLKNISLEIPRNKVVVFTGLSGSGKSSLVFDTIYAEAQRQLLETFSSFARSRLPKIERPKVDAIKNISPVIIIDQDRPGSNRRSTVGTATEIYTYLRLLYSRIGDPFVGFSNVFSFNNPDGMCPVCQGIGKELIIDIDALIDSERSLSQGAIRHADYKVNGYLWRCIRDSGLFDMEMPLKEFNKDDFDRLLNSEQARVKKEDKNGAYYISFEGIITAIKRRRLGRDDIIERDAKVFKMVPCKACNGTRLNDRALSCKINGKNIAELSSMELTALMEFLEDTSGPVAEPIIGPIKERIKNLIDIGVGYLSLDRETSTLSGGESQRLKMAKQLNCDLINLIYILDEPSIGLHARDNASLIRMLRRLRDNGNSVLVVEHDPGIIESADYAIDMGPGPGTLGGEVIFQGTIEELKNSSTLTGKYLDRAQNGIYERRKAKGYIEIRDASLHNLKNVSVKIPTGIFVCVTGVAGSGKSTLINDIFTPSHPEAVVIDQSRPFRSMRSIPATYTGAFDMIREEFSNANGVSPTLFSFNSEGACPKCKGNGYIEIEMHFLESVRVVCDECKGKRYTGEVLCLKYKGKSIYDVLEMTVDEALEFFDNKKILHILETLQRVGLGYLTLGQPLSTLSGGECQRIKLADELKKKGNIYVMDEPTTGLHMADTDRLLKIIDELVDAGNTVIVIEHNLDVIKHADWVIDLGPEGGSNGGQIVAEGTPEDIAKAGRSYTGQYLKELLRSK